MIDVDALEDQLERALAANLGFVPVAKPAPEPPPEAAPAPPSPAQAGPPPPHAAPPPPPPASPPPSPPAPPRPSPPPRPEPRPFRARSGWPENLERAENGERFWLVLHWGGEDERYELLDDCRRRAYTYGELPWRAALTLLLADLGRRDEAARELEATVAECHGLVRDARWLDMVTNLAEAAFLLGDLEGARTLQKWLADLPEQMVSAGPSDVCKGSLGRYQAHAAAVVGAWSQADRGFRTAVDAHRALDEGPLLARTLQQWGRSLSGRDDLLARRCLQESEELAAEIGLPWGRGARTGDPAVPTPA